MKRKGKAYDLPYTSALKKRYGIKRNMMLGEIDARRIDDPTEAPRAIARKQPNIVSLIETGPMRPKSAFHHYGMFEITDAKARRTFCESVDKYMRKLWRRGW